MLPHSTVAGIHLVAAVAAACKSPVVVGTVVVGEVRLVPSDIHYMLPHSTVAGIHFGDAAAAACKSPIVVGTVAAWEVVVPSGIRYVTAVAAGIAVAEVVGSVVAAFVGAIVAWDISGSGAVVAVTARDG